MKTVENVLKAMKASVYECYNRSDWLRQNAARSAREFESATINDEIFSIKLSRVVGVSAVHREDATIFLEDGYQKVGVDFRGPFPCSGLADDLGFEVF